MTIASNSIAKALRTIDLKLAELRKKRVEAVLRPLHRERRRLHARIEKINQVIVRARGKVREDEKVAKEPMVKANRGKKRTRRSSDGLKKVALRVVEFVKSKGKMGVKPKEIKAAFGNLVPPPRAICKKVWRSAASFQRTCQASAILCFVSAAITGWP
jgi:hypothetical protein